MYICGKSTSSQLGQDSHRKLQGHRTPDKEEFNQHYVVHSTSIELFSLDEMMTVYYDDDDEEPGEEERRGGQTAQLLLFLWKYELQTFKSSVGKKIEARPKDGATSNFHSVQRIFRSNRR